MKKACPRDIALALVASSLVLNACATSTILSEKAVAEQLRHAAKIQILYDEPDTAYVLPPPGAGESIMGYPNPATFVFGMILDAKERAAAAKEKPIRHTVKPLHPEVTLQVASYFQQRIKTPVEVSGSLYPMSEVPKGIEHAKGYDLSDYAVQAFRQHANSNSPIVVVKLGSGLHPYQGLGYRVAFGVHMSFYSGNQIPRVWYADCSEFAYDGKAEAILEDFLKDKGKLLDAHRREAMNRCMEDLVAEIDRLSL